MDKEKFENNQEKDYSGYSEEDNDKAIDKPVDLTAGQWSNVSSKIIFAKKKLAKVKQQ